MCYRIITCVLFVMAGPSLPITCYKEDFKSQSICESETSECFRMNINHSRVREIGGCAETPACQTVRNQSDFLLIFDQFTVTDDQIGNCMECSTDLCNKPRPQRNRYDDFCIWGKNTATHNKNTNDLRIMCCMMLPLILHN